MTGSTPPAAVPVTAVLRVAVIDSRRLVREGLAALIGDEPDLEVSACLAAIGSDSQRSEAAGADVIVSGRGSEAAGAEVIVTGRGSEAAGAEEIMAGRGGRAAGWPGRIVRLHDDHDASALIAAVRDRAPSGSDAPARPASGALTARELTVLRAVGSGQSAQQIAAGLGLSARTVEGHKQSILAKLAVQSQAQAVVRAQELGLL